MKSKIVSINAIPHKAMFLNRCMKFCFLLRNPLIIQISKMMAPMAIIIFHKAGEVNAEA